MIVKSFVLKFYVDLKFKMIKTTLYTFNQSLKKIIVFTFYIEWWLILQFYLWALCFVNEYLRWNNKLKIKYKF